MNRAHCIILALCLGAAVLQPADAACRRKPFAVVVDGACYEAVAGSVKHYADAVASRDSRQVFVVVTGSDWTPQTIRDTLRVLHDRKKLDGAVLVGDIPVPMIRRAHHLATAFKMNPAMPVKRSSIPSDRFYDDFGLRFDFLDADGKLFYYDLSPEGRQRVQCDIYTARIKPSKADPDHSFEELICEFLDRAARTASGTEPLDNVFHFGGHGNSSESINARIDEDRAFYEQFGLAGSGERVRYLNFDEERFVRKRLMSALSDPEVDFAHLHTHGGVGAQYISKEPYTFMTNEHIENAKAFFRSKMRSAKDKEKAAASLMKSYDIPASWLEGWDDKAVTAKDSLRSASVDITLPDLDGYRSAAKLILLDACFNGAFLHDDYVAARYAFGHGSRTIAVTGNSVNIIQDHWKNELAGLLKAGCSVGEWSRNYMTLESHLFGDPTFRFAASGKKGPDARKAKAIHDGRYAPEKCLALMDDSSMNVRLEAFYYILREGSYETLRNAVRKGLDDPYEMLRRMAARYAETLGEKELLPVIASQYLDPMETARVRYHLFAAFSQYGADEVEAALQAAWDGIWPEPAELETLKARLRRSITASDAEIAGLADASVSLKDRISTVSAQRNANLTAAVEPMLGLVADEAAAKELRCKAAEALGWYTRSVQSEHIYQSLKKIQTSDGDVADEVRRTLRRLEDNAHIR